MASRTALLCVIATCLSPIQCEPRSEPLKPKHRYRTNMEVYNKPKIIPHQFELPEDSEKLIEPTKKTSQSEINAGNSPYVSTKVRTKWIPLDAKRKANTSEYKYVTFKTSHFLTLRYHPLFIDKTNYIIEVMNESDEYLLMTAAKRFGKTIFLDMMKTFLELEVDNRGNPLYQNFDQRRDSENFKVFLGTKIDPNSVDNLEFFQNHFGQYPVLHIDFSTVPGGTYRKILFQILNRIHDSLKPYGYLATSNDEHERWIYNKFRFIYEEGAPDIVDIGFSDYVKEICVMLTMRFNKPVVLMIDEWDAPLTQALQSEEVSSNEFKQLHSDLQSLVTCVVKDSDDRSFVKKTILTGIISLTGDPFVLTHRHFLQDMRYSTLFGFSHNEVLQLLQKSPWEIDMEDVVQMYDGYIAPDGSAIFNPWSLIHVASTGKFEKYWAYDMNQTKTVETCLLPKLYPVMLVLLDFGTHLIHELEEPGIQDLLYLKQILDHTIKVESTSIIFQFLYENGILCGQRVYDKKLLLKIPNLEIQEKLEQKLKVFSQMRKYYQIPLVLQQPLVDNFKKLTVANNITVIDKIMKTICGNLSMLFQYAVKRTEKEYFEPEPLLRRKSHKNDFQSVLFILLSKLFSFDLKDGRGANLDPLQFQKRLYSDPKSKKDHEARIDIIMAFQKTNFIFEIKYTDSETASVCAVKQISAKDDSKNNYAYIKAFELEPFLNYERAFLIGMNIFSNHSVQISYLWATKSQSGSIDFDETQIKTIPGRFETIPERLIQFN